MRRANVTEYLAEYMEMNNISITRVAADTGVSEKKLIPGTTEILDAAEFLNLCEYLSIRPEEIRQILV